MTVSRRAHIAVFFLCGITAGQLTRITWPGIGFGGRVLIALAVAAAFCTGLSLWARRWDILYWALHGTWTVLTACAAGYRRARTQVRIWRGGNPPHGVYVHLVSGRDIPLTPVFRGVGTDGREVWDLVHDRPVRIAPHEMRGVEIKGADRSDCTFRIAFVPYSDSLETFRIVAAPR